MAVVPGASVPGQAVPGAATPGHPGTAATPPTPTSGPPFPAWHMPVKARRPPRRAGGRCASNPGSPPSNSPYYQYVGLTPALYLQYLGPGGTLHAAPGDRFPTGAVSEASGWPYSLTVPPADGRWVSSAGLFGALRLRAQPEGPSEYAVMLAKARALNAELQAAAALRGPAPQPGGT